MEAGTGVVAIPGIVAELFGARGQPRTEPQSELTEVGGNVTCDVRTHYMRVYRALGVNGIMNLLYPRMLAVHDLAPDVGFLGTNGRLRLPAFMRASYAYMVAEGAYILCELVFPI